MSLHTNRFCHDHSSVFIGPALPSSRTIRIILIMYNHQVVSCYLYDALSIECVDRFICPSCI